MKFNTFIPVAVIVLLLFLQCNTKTATKIKETPNTFTLNAYLEGLEEDYLVYYEKDEKYHNGLRSDTLWVKDQKITFTDSITDYKIYFIGVPQTSKKFEIISGDKTYQASIPTPSGRMWFIGYPGAKIDYTGKITDFIDAYPHDSINDELALINAKTFPVLNEIANIKLLSNKGELTHLTRKEINDSLKKLNAVVRNLKIDFIKSHPSSVAASYIFSDAYYRKNYTHEEAKLLFANMDSIKLAKVPFYLEVKQRLEAVENIMIGMEAPEIITSNTLDGSKFKLSSLRGNYVLIDYWGTWCGPCMAEMSKIKEYHNKYSDKNFIVLGIDSGDTVNRWKNAIEKNELDWRHIRTTKDNNLLIPFNVTSFPTKILLDPSGKIIYNSKNTQEKIDLYQLIDRIFLKS